MSPTTRTRVRSELPGQVGERQVLHFHHGQSLAVGAGRHRLVLGELTRSADRLVAGEILEDLVHLAADLGDGGADCVGHGLVGNVEDARRRRPGARHQERAAADGDQGRVGRLGLHPVDPLLEHGADAGEGLLHQRGGQRGHPRAVAEVDEAGGHRDVGDGEDVAAEHERLLGEAIAHAGRPDGERRRPRGHARSTAQAEGQQVGHAEERAHAADLDHVVGLAGEAVAEAADVGSGAPHVDHQRLVAGGEEGGPAHGVGRPRGEGVDGIGLGHLRQHDGAVVLGEIERRLDAAPTQGLREGARCLAGQLDQAGVEQGRVLALEQADAAEAVGQGDGDVGALLAEDGRRLLLAGGVQWREHCGDRDRADARRADAPGRLAHALLVERHERAAVELVAALQHDDLAADQVGQVLRPVHEGRQRGAGGQADAHGGHPAEVAPLHHRVGEMGSPDHGRVGFTRGRRPLDEFGQGAGDPRGHVRGGGCLHGGGHRVVLQKDGVGVGAADVDADPPSHAKTERKSRS